MSSYREEKISNEIGKTISVLKNNENIESSPFLFTKIQAQIKEDVEQERNNKVIGILKPAFLILLVVILNMITITNYFENENNYANRDAYISQFAKQYLLTSNKNDYLNTLFPGE